MTKVNYHIKYRKRLLSTRRSYHKRGGLEIITQKPALQIPTTDPPPHTHRLYPANLTSLSCQLKLIKTQVLISQ